jgi:hypothetical protein
VDDLENAVEKNLPLGHQASMVLRASAVFAGPIGKEKRMVSSRLIAVALVALAGGAGLMAADQVGVPGSATTFPSQAETSLGGPAVKLRLTGTAMRTKYLFNVYALASYVVEGVKVGSPEELAAIDRSKQLHLVMERNVDGKDMAEAFRAAIRMNYPEPVFNDEVATLVQFIRSIDAQKGDHVYLTHVPGVGLHCYVAGKGAIQIKNLAFSRAVWDMYLGKNNLGEQIKKGLVSRL